jgi:pimeloyl-ACP methyl ester carboxylesterase
MVWAALPHIFGRDYLRTHEKNADRIVKTIVRRNNTDAVRAHLEALVRYRPLSDELKPLAPLSLVLSGEDDPLISPEGVAELARICGGREALLQGVGHSITAEAPRRMAALIGEFLSPLSYPIVNK